MCRFVCYLGAPVALDELLLAPSRSLLRQSWEPRHQAHGVVNADGFGVAWYDHAVRAEPARYRSARPLWADRNLPSFGPLVRAGAIVAAVRSATPPSPVEETGAQPFVADAWAFVHNGFVRGFHEGAGERLRRMLSIRRAAAIEGATDSEVLFGLALDHLDGGATPREALAGVAALAARVGGGPMTMALTDGRSVAALAAGSSLFVREARDHVVVASEPFDDDGAWRRVGDGTLLRAEPGSVVEVPLDDVFVEEDSPCRRPVTPRVAEEAR